MILKTPTTNKKHFKKILNKNASTGEALVIRKITKNEAFSNSMLKFSANLESYTRVLSTLSSITALVISFCGWLRA